MILIRNQIMERRCTIHITYIQGTIGSALHLCPEADLQMFQRISELRQYGVCIAAGGRTEIERVITLVYISIRTTLHYVRSCIGSSTTRFPTYRSNTLYTISNTLVSLETFDEVAFLCNRVNLAKGTERDRTGIFTNSCRIGRIALGSYLCLINGRRSQTL